MTGARDPILVPEVSQHEIRVRQGFTGAELLLFGAILSPDGTRAGQDYDIVVVLKGPTSPAILREKRKIAGIWINADSTELHSVPAYFAVASTRPIGKIVDGRPRRSMNSACPGCNCRRPGRLIPSRSSALLAGWSI